MNLVSEFVRASQSSQGTKLSGGEQQMLADRAGSAHRGPSFCMLDERREGLATVICPEIGRTIRGA